jgi:tetratricopeptide (TPR) repeat protein
MARSTSDLEAAFERDPLDDDAFTGLRRAYKKAGDVAKLAVLLEQRAARLEDGHQAAELYWEAAELVQADGNAKHAEELVRRTLARYPAHPQAAHAVKEKLKAEGRLTEYADVLSRELETLEQARAEPRRLAEIHHELGHLYEDHFARLDRAMQHYQAAFKLEPSLSQAIESGRRIYRSLGDWPMVARLYELELEVAGGAKRKAELLVALGRLLAERLGEYGPAAERLEEARRLRPDDEKIGEALGGVLAHPDFPEETGLDRAAHVFLELGRKRLGEGDGENASVYLRRALGADPDNEEAARLLEETYQTLERWQDLDRLYRQRLATATGPDVVDLLMRRAQLAEEQLNDRAEAKRCYESILPHEPATMSGPATRRLLQMYGQDLEWQKLGNLRASLLERCEDPQIRAQLRVELGLLYEDQLDDPDAAAAMWMGILEDEPLHEQAFAHYGEYLKKRHDFRALADLLEFSLEAMATASMSTEKQVQRLEEVADLAEKRLGDVERAVAAWRRIDELQGGKGVDRTRDALKRLMAKAKMWEGLVGVLEKEAREAGTPNARAEVLKRMAQVYREKQVDPRRAIQLYEQALEVTPQDAVALRALSDLYERENDWEGHAKSLRRLLDLSGTKIERLNLLRKLAAVYADKVGDVEEATWACTEVLESVPGDRDSLSRLEGLLEEAGRWQRLLKTLEYHAETSATPAEKAKILKRMAVVAGDKLDDDLDAITRWEAVRKLQPDDADAVTELSNLYEKIGRWPELVALLERRLHRSEAGSPQAMDLLRRLGRIALEKTNEPLRALKAWRKIIEADAQDREALTALSQLLRGQAHERRALADVLERLIALDAGADPFMAADMALERARLLVEENDVPAAAAQLEALLADMNPRSLEAHAVLRGLYEKLGQFEKALRIAERELFLEGDAGERVRRGLEIAALWKSKLNDARRAAQAYERVLEMENQHEGALAALAPLYLECGERERYLELQEKRIEQAVDPATRHRLLVEGAEAAENGMRDAQLAFEWRRRAYADAPGTEEMDALVALAERHALWEDMIRFYDQARGATPGVDAARKIAEICERKLSDPKRALAVLRDALPADPEGRQILGEIERLADEAKDPQALLDVYARVGRARREPGEKVELLRLRAIVREERMRDPSGAMDEHLLAFNIAPDDDTTREHLARLAGATGRWEDVLRTEAFRFQRAADTPAKLVVARRAAAVVEEKLDDKVRAFRAYLNAFRLVPEDQEVLGHLWRLAREIGEYKPAENKIIVESSKPPREPTQEVPLSDIEVLETRDPTLELDARMLRELKVKDPTMQLSTQDLSEVAVKARKPPPLAGRRGGPPPAPGMTGAAGGAPPPPPRKAGSRPPVTAATTGAPPNVKTPWEELALAYETLPQDGPATTVNRLLQIADLWERGAGDLDRAFAALEKAFRMDPDEPKIRDAIEKLGKDKGAWERVSAIYLRLADEGGSADRNVRLHLEVARIHEEAGRIPEAEEQYNSVLAIQPSHEHALGRLEEMYRTTDRWSDLAALLERRTAGLLERLPPGPRRTSALRELAELYETKLAKPYEAVDAAVRLAQEEPDNPDVYALEARLYSQVQMWAKVVEACSREAEHSDRTRAKEARRRIAEVYEKNLELPDRAVEAYRGLLEADPNDEGALAALDRLLTAMSRWKDVEVVIKRRAAKADAQARVELVRRRAEILDEKLGDADQAANAYKELRSLGLADDPVITERLLATLRRANRAREAATLLNERVAALEAQNATPEQVAEALCELGVLRAGPLQDENGARKTFERALKLVPNHPTALAELARLHLGGADYRGYAQAREREAQVQSDPVRAANALVEAAAVYRDQLNDPTKAKECFGRAYELDPRSRPAVAGLLRFAEDEGRWEVAHALGQKRLEVIDDANDKADALVALARAAQKQGNGDEAHALLDEAVALVPSHVAAVEALADLEFSAGRYQEAEELLERALDAVKDDAEKSGRIHYRMGECFDRLGKLDEGYRALLEADKANPGQLMLRLALGENRYRARRWREAASHLGAVGEHKDAAKYADAVAVGLVHAAESEIKMRRAERAPMLYEAALRIKADCAEALLALADLAQKNGDRAGAANYRERAAAARSDGAQLEKAGDAMAELDDAPGARRAYERALLMLAPDAPPPILLLEKLLPLQRDAGDLEAAQRTAELLVAAETGERRAGRRRVAAALAHARGDVQAALEHWTRALEDDSTDETALLALSDIGDPREAAALLTRVINHLPEPKLEAEALGRRAALWEKLGILRRDVIKDPRGAVQALEKAIEIDPSRRVAREALADLYGDSPEFGPMALTNHRALLSLDILREPSLRAIARLYAQAGAIAKARLVYQVLELAFGLSQEERAFMAAHPARAFDPDDAFPGVLDDGDRTRTAIPEARALADVFAALYEGAPTLYGRSFESFGVTPQDRVSPVSKDVAARVFGQITRALGNKKTGLYLKRDRGLDGIAVLSHPPTGVLIGPRIAEATPPAELRFVLGRTIELARPEYILAAAADPKEFAQLFAAVLRAYHPRHARRKTADAVAELAVKIKKLLPYTASKRLAELFQKQSAVSWSSAEWRSAVRLTADRVGLLVCGDLRSAVRVLVRENEPDLPDDPPPEELAALVKRSAPLRDILTFALSEEYFAASAKLFGDKA